MTEDRTNEITQEELMKQIKFQENLYKDKRNMEAMGLILTALEKVDFSPERKEKLEEKLFTLIINHLDKPTEESSLIK